MDPASFLTRKWRQSYRGNLYLRLQGVAVVVFKGWSGPWYYQVAGEYSPHGYASDREAKLAAFEAFRRVVPQPARTPRQRAQARQLRLF
jgi:hypothetical protein